MEQVGPGTTKSYDTKFGILGGGSGGIIIGGKMNAGLISGVGGVPGSSGGPPMGSAGGPSVGISGPNSSLGGMVGIMVGGGGSSGGSGPGKGIRDTLLTNRVKIMRSCDYFIVSAPLISKRLLPLDKHKEIKTCAIGITDAKAANNARMDALLDYMDEYPIPAVFDSFLDGVKQCDTNKGFAKVLKKEAYGGVDIHFGAKPALKKPVVKPKPKLSVPPVAVQSQFINGPQAQGGYVPIAISPYNKPTVPPAIAAAKKPRAKKPKVVAPGAAPPRTVPGVSPAGAAPVIPGTPKKPRTPRTKQQAKAGVGGPQTPGSTPTVPKKEKKPRVPKTKLPKPAKASTGPSLTANLVFKKEVAESSSSAAPAPPATPSNSKSGFNTNVPAGSPFGTKNPTAKNNQIAKEMTFQQAVEKQQTLTRANGFAFTNRAAVVKSINFNNKSDLFYEGCPYKDGNFLCTKKVQLKGKGKKYVCKDKHENENYRLFPKLSVIFSDSTGQMETTLFRENVEIIAGKTVSEMENMNDAAMTSEFQKAYGQNVPIRVTCDKVLKKDLKKAGGKAWNNVATIINTSSDRAGKSGGPPSKKPRKSSGD